MINERVMLHDLGEQSLQAQIDIKADPEKVFMAWTDRDRFAQWFGPPKRNGSLEVAHFDCQVGGTFDVSMVFADGDKVQLTGEYLEVDPPKKIVFSWLWTDGTDTLVTVDIAPIETGSRLTLTHERFVSVEDRDSHQQGWSMLLPIIAEFVEST
jgi:uncharacterized protein YndB with AHSA1/START domain